MTNIFESFENLSAQIELDAIARSVECNVDVFESVESVATELYHHDRGLGMESIYIPYMSAEDDVDGAKDGAAKQGIFKRIVAAIKAFFMKIINFIKSVWRKFWGLFAKKKLKEAAEVVVEDDTAMLYKGYKTYDEAVKSEGEDKVVPFTVRMSVFYNMFNNNGIDTLISQIVSVVGTLSEYVELGKKIYAIEKDSKDADARDKSIDNSLKNYKETIKRNFRTGTKSTENVARALGDEFKALSTIFSATNIKEVTEAVRKFAEADALLKKDKEYDEKSDELNKLLDSNMKRDADFWKKVDVARKTAVDAANSKYKEVSKSTYEMILKGVIETNGSEKKFATKTLIGMYATISKLDRNQRKNLLDSANKKVDPILNVINKLEYLSSGVTTIITAAEKSNADVTVEHLRAVIAFIDPVTAFLNSCLSLVKKYTESITKHDYDTRNTLDEMKNKDYENSKKRSSTTKKKTKTEKTVASNVVAKNA